MTAAFDPIRASARIGLLDDAPDRVEPATVRRAQAPAASPPPAYDSMVGFPPASVDAVRAVRRLRHEVLEAAHRDDLEQADALLAEADRQRRTLSRTNCDALTCIFTYCSYWTD